MSEIRANEVFLAGRIAQGPVQTKDGLVQFLFEASVDQEPFHCLCEGATAENIMKYCHPGDEASLEGELRWRVFPNTGKTLIIFVRYVSYGRKARTISEIPGN